MKDGLCGSGDKAAATGAELKLVLVFSAYAKVADMARILVLSFVRQERGPILPTF